ncbi:MAG: short-chain dehydrogenase [Deltaproteobacteria bacterium]|nr:MAG: short-chain dehydrogenase [Deltaproteobacteria bacterium]
MKQDFVGKVAWITGAGSGLGRACAIELGRRGAVLALSGRRLDRLEEVAQQLGELDVQAVAVPCNVRDESQQRQAVQQVIAAHGRLDVAIANAGLSVPGTIEELSGEDWRRQLETNVVGAALTARHALGELQKTAGRLALIGSVSGFMPAPGFGAYHASKHAIRALGLTLAAELHGTGVSCTTVHPGFVESEIGRVDSAGHYDPNRLDHRPRLLMWSAARAARVIVDAIGRRRREVVFTGHGKLAAFLCMHFPALTHAVLTFGPVRRQVANVRPEEG